MTDRALQLGAYWAYK
jgi:hypothetical protein